MRGELFAIGLKACMAIIDGFREEDSSAEAIEWFYEGISVFEAWLVLLLGRVVGILHQQTLAADI
jgi:hypothetical protein